MTARHLDVISYSYGKQPARSQLAVSQTGRPPTRVSPTQTSPSCACAAQHQLIAAIHRGSLVDIHALVDMEGPNCRTTLLAVARVQHKIVVVLHLKLSALCAVLDSFAMVISIDELDIKP